jgi:dTDP-4-dehydrorhamnose 3,5-epimerase-like enzyme
MAPTLIKETEDARGKITWLTAGGKEIHIVETKKGFARGGHYHPFESVHLVVSGRLVYTECDIKAENTEITKTIDHVATIVTPAYRAHMIAALEDSTFIEIFDPPYRAADYKPYRSIVESSMKK